MKELTKIFAALSDETRFALVTRLLDNGEQPAGALAANTDITAPAISRHLKVLREAGVIRQRAEGTKRFYSVRPEAMQAISGWTMDHQSFWEASLNRLDAFLAESGETRND
jgi:DNA-binding transcriptional ArsR family regulator